MNKFLVVFLSAMTIFQINCFAADLDVGTHASFFLPPEGGGNTLMTGIDVSYRINDLFSTKGSADNANYTTLDHKYTITSLTVDLIWHTLGRNFIDPYLGLGAVNYDKSIDSVHSSTTGLNALAGLSMIFQTFSAGIEVEYTVPDSNHMETGYYSAGGQFLGGLHVTL